MPNRGQLPDVVALRDGTSRPCKPDEVDHKLFRLEDQQFKVALRKQELATQQQAQELTEVRAELVEMRMLMRQLVGASTQRNVK